MGICNTYLNMKTTITPADLQGRGEIETLVNAFYARVRLDPMLGFIFEDVAGTDWSHHLPRMYSFWEKVLFGTGDFSGNPLAVHARLVSMTEMGRPQFDRWLEIFKSTVDDLFAGPNAEHLKNIATDMANVIHRRINGIHEVPFSGVPSSEGPPSRYASYRANAGT